MFCCIIAKLPDLNSLARRPPDAKHDGEPFRLPAIKKPSEPDGA
jgi:hypothetical protein